MTEQEYEDRQVALDLPGDDDEPDWYIQEGDYPFRCIKAVLKESSRGPHDYVELTLLTYAPYDNMRREITHRCSLAPKAVWNLKKTLKAMGLPASGRINLDLDAMVGKWIMATTEDAEYKGRLKSEISDIYEMDDDPPNWSELESAEEEEGEEGGSDFWGDKEDNTDLPW